MLQPGAGLARGLPLFAHRMATHLLFSRRPVEGGDRRARRSALRPPRRVGQRKVLPRSGGVLAQRHGPGCGGPAGVGGAGGADHSHPHRPSRGLSGADDVCDQSSGRGSRGQCDSRGASAEQSGNPRLPDDRDQQQTRTGASSHPTRAGGKSNRRVEWTVRGPELRGRPTRAGGKSSCSDQHGPPGRRGRHIVHGRGCAFIC